MRHVPAAVRGAIVLAGGPSRRMGRPKALLRIGGDSLVARVVAAAVQVVDEVLVVTRGPLAASVAHVVPASVRIVRDDRRLQSPLVGLLAGAECARSAYVAALGCDLPFLRPAILRRLFRDAARRDAAVPRWENGMIEPLVAVYRRRALAAASRDTLAQGGRSNQDMLDRLRRVAWVPMSQLRRLDPDLRSFLNVNSPADLARARALSPRRAPRPRTR